MNSNQVNQLKTVLRKYGNKNSENIVKQETGMKYSQFLECAESIYVIPESGLRELPLVGDKMLRGLAPFLEKYNIIIDSSK